MRSANRARWSTTWRSIDRPLACRGRRATGTADVGPDGSAGCRTDGARPRRPHGDDCGVFDPTGRWLTAEDLSGVTFWPATRRWPSVLRVAADQPRDVVFDPAGKWIAAASRKGGVEIWPSTVNGFPRRSCSRRACTCPNWPFRRTASSSRQVQGLEACWSCRLQGQASESCRGSKGWCVGCLRCHGKANRCEWARGWRAKRGHSRL